MTTYPVLGVDKSSLGYIISTSMRRILVILGVLTIGVMADDWPMFQHDPKHKGKSEEVGPEDSISYWKTPFETESPIQTSPIVGVIGEETFVYIGTYGRLYAINPTDSPQVKWYYDTPYNPIRGIAVDRYGKVVYCGSANDTLYPLDALTGSPLTWNYGAENPISTPITLNGYNIYFGSYRHFHWLKNNGDTELVYPLEPEALNSCAPAVDDTGTMYFQTSSNTEGGATYFYALASDGSEAWWIELGGESSPAIGDNGVIYIGSKGYIYGIEEGSPIYYMEIGTDIKSTPAIGKNGRVYIGSDNGHIYCLSPTLDSIIWSYLTNGAIEGAPVIDGAGNIYVGSADGYLWSFTSDGLIRWKYKTSDPIRYPPAIGPKGIVYVASGKHLYAIGPGSTTGVKENLSNRPFRLHISPNPFKDFSVIGFQLPARNSVSLKIYNASGRLVKVLIKTQSLESGSYKLRWDGRDKRGGEVPEGIYFCKFSTPFSSITEKMIMVK